MHPVKRIVAPREPTSFESLSDAVSRFRRSVSDRILAAMSPRAGPIAAAFLTGERGLISEEDNEAMRDSSLAHLLSISGLHMALAGFGFFAALRLLLALTSTLSLNYPVKKWAAAGALVASAFYLLLSGASLPTQRSFVMIAVALIAIIFDRSALSMRTVAIAAAVVLVLTPEAWMDPSFQMSFAAVAALIAAYEWWATRRIADVEPPGIFRRAARMVAAAAATSLIAGLATAPFAAYHFNRFSDYGVPANVMVMPLVSFAIMPAGVLALLLMPFGLEAIPLAVMGEGIEAMLAVAHWVSSWPGATQAVGAMRIESLALITAGGLWMAVWQASWRLLGIGLVAAGMATAALTTQPDVLIAADGDNVAIRGSDGQLHLLSSRRGRFDAEIWLRRDGDQREFADIRADHPMGFVCDATGCRAHVGGDPARSVLALWSIEALAEDCATTPIVIDLTRGWHPPCTAAKLFVNRSRLQREGAIAARFEGNAVTWTSVARERGDRPWVAPKPVSSGGRALSNGPAP
jgi:competence protein ComEC